MNTPIRTTIVGTGSYIPTRRIPNSYFLDREFYDPDGNRIDRDGAEVIEKFEAITGIKERRYVTDDLNTSDVAFLAAKDALESSGIDKESLDYIIVGHNIGDLRHDNRRADFVPSLGSRVKYLLEIENPNTIPYDIPFGCPGWLQGMIQADYFIKSGDAKRALVIGAEIISRATDPHDRDSMIYADGAGATILEGVATDSPIGVLAHHNRSDTRKFAYMLWMGESWKKDYENNELFIKMHGHKLYEYALRTVPKVIKQCMEKAGVTVSDISKVLLHQANAKMDDAMLKRTFKLYGVDDIPDHVMPMTISWLGNSSVATLPTLYDLIIKEKLNNHKLESGQNVLFASVGAGMNINAMVYRLP
ncbi:MAG: ketoacyl-ACP synthase III [Candidatus Latescibacterota bacterium]|nr:MAG: ketoacyl-ACP synthase III [Candidatus Latescibacterota bacterium]